MEPIEIVIRMEVLEHGVSVVYVRSFRIVTKADKAKSCNKRE